MVVHEASRSKLGGVAVVETVPFEEVYPPLGVQVDLMGPMAMGDA